MKKVILFFCMCIAFTSVYSQNIKIKGSIVENSNEVLTELTGVSINLHLMDSSYVSGVVSDQQGRFLLEKIRPGDYYLNISYIGFETQNVALKNLTGDVDLGVIEMVESTTELGEVVVSAGNIVQKTDRMVVLPTQTALKNAYDSYELLNNLNIPRLRVNPLSKTIDRKSTRLNSSH